MRNSLLMTTIALCLCLCLNACATDTPENNQQGEQSNENNHVKGFEADPNQDSTDIPPENRDADDVANRLTDLAVSVDDVNKAAAVVAGRWAAVAIDVDQNLGRDEVGMIKYSVAEALKDDPMGANAVITADSDMMYRFEQMNQDIRDGKPLAGIMEELANIAGRWMPEVPRDIADPQPAGQQQDEQ